VDPARMTPVHDDLHGPKPKGITTPDTLPLLWNCHP